MIYHIFIPRFGGEGVVAIVVGNKDVELIANDFVNTIGELNIINEKALLKK